MNVVSTDARGRRIPKTSARRTTTACAGTAMSARPKSRRATPLVQHAPLPGVAALRSVEAIATRIGSGGVSTEARRRSGQSSGTCAMADSRIVLTISVNGQCTLSA